MENQGGMALNFRTILVGAAFIGLAAGQAQAQYYAPPPPAYGYGYPHRPPPPGGQCDAFLRTPYGTRRVVCPMGVPKPVGYDCTCPPPGPYGRPAHGRVIP